MINKLKRWYLIIKVFVWLVKAVEDGNIDAAEMAEFQKLAKELNK